MIKMSVGQAKYHIEKSNWDVSKLVKDRDQNYDDLRSTIVNAYSFAEQQGSSTSAYLKDIEVGMAIYIYLSKQDYFNLQLASNTEFWIYVQVRVIPDIIIKRWGVNADRMFAMGRRIWLMQIWWYIHLCWQGNNEDFDRMNHIEASEVKATREAILTMNTDTILNLVERTGSGYRIQLYRQIIKEYSRRKLDNEGRDVFRKVMTRNTVFLTTIEPECYEGGIEGYVKMLFEE